MNMRPGVRCTVEIGRRNPRMSRGPDLLTGVRYDGKKRDTVFLNVDLCGCSVYVVADFAAELIVPAASLFRHIPGGLPTTIVGKRCITLAGNTASVALRHLPMDAACHRNREAGVCRVTHHALHLHNLPRTVQVAIRNNHGTVLCCGANLVVSRRDAAPASSGRSAGPLAVSAMNRLT